MTVPDLDALRTALREELSLQLAEQRRFIDRRLAELSAEIHGATQLLGFSEDNLSAQLRRLQDELGRMLARPAEASRNSGLELEAVVQSTEAAANQIMEAAEAIADALAAALPDKSAMASVTAKIDAIFEACAFQDLTGQRVRRRHGTFAPYGEHADRYSRAAGHGGRYCPAMCADGGVNGAGFAAGRYRRAFCRLGYFRPSYQAA